MPKRNASAIYQMRSAPGTRSAWARRLRAASASSAGIEAWARSRKLPISSERSAFCNDSWKVRPIAIASPTDFICVVSVGSALGNFSKVKRGTLVTT